VTPPPRFEVKAPDGAPNVLIILIDDMGFGMPSAFGGPIHMPTVERLAAAGLRYNQFHTTALCAGHRRRETDGSGRESRIEQGLRGNRREGRNGEVMSDSDGAP